MKKKPLFIITIIIIITTIFATRFIYNTNKYSFKNLTIAEVKSVTLFPFQSARTIDTPYTYSKATSEDIQAMNVIVKGLNTIGRKVKVFKGPASMNGGADEYWQVNLTNGKSINLGIYNKDQVMIGPAVYSSPELVNVLSDELNRIYPGKYLY